MTDAPSAEFDRLSTLLADQYRIDGEIGRGGMGIVVRARDLRLDRDVAIKTLPSHLARDASIRERFLREAKTAASLSHPNIVPIYHADEVDETVFFVMELIAGCSIAQRIRESGPATPESTIAVLRDVASALGYAHARQVIHRDVKAENILLDSENARAMVTDFGIARLAQAAPMTATGTVLGTVYYMSPEQVAGEELDGRSDLYSLGVLAFYMLTARFPFEHDSPSAVLVAHVMSRAPAVERVNPAVPPPLAEVVNRLLVREKAQRYERASDVSAALEAAQAALAALSAAVPTPALLSASQANRVWERAALFQQLTGVQDAVVPPLPVEAHDIADVTPESGYKAEQVLDAAVEAGIAPKYVERALAEQRAPTAVPDLIRPGEVMKEPIGRFAGTRTRLEFESTLDGELSEGDVEELIDELRRSVGEFGMVSAVGKTTTFSTQSVSANSGYPRRLLFTITSRNGRTTIRAFEDARGLGNGIMWGVTAGGGVGVGTAIFGVIMGITKGAAFVVAPLVGLVMVPLLAWQGARAILRTTMKGRVDDITHAMQRVIARAQDLLAARKPRLGAGKRAR